MKYIGDLSQQDAALLARYTCTARAVLEFGVGASTQVIAQSLSKQATFTSLDTDPNWIVATQHKLRKLGVEDRCRLLAHGEWSPDPSCQFDLIFDDGVDHLRETFAMQSFPLLEVGGTLLFHDTRRVQDVRTVLKVVEVFFEEIEHVYLNERIDGVSSNITVLKKKAREPYVDWNVTEHRPAWAVGYGEVPDTFWK